MLYYQNYEIPEKEYLSSEEMHVLYACCWMVDNQSTIRKTASILLQLSGEESIMSVDSYLLNYIDVW